MNSFPPSVGPAIPTHCITLQSPGLTNARNYILLFTPLWRSFVCPCLGKLALFICEDRQRNVQQVLLVLCYCIGFHRSFNFRVEFSDKKSPGSNPWSEGRSLTGDIRWLSLRLLVMVKMVKIHYQDPN